jgi:hypothetical protein
VGHQRASRQFQNDFSAPQRSPQRHALKDRKDDCYETPPAAVHALLKVERIPRVVWEPACGPGAIVNVLRTAGHIVHATDLVDYGLPDSTGGVDFLMEWRTPPGTECIITNPPNKLATQFAEHALRLCPRLMLLQPVQWLGAEERTLILDGGTLARVHVFKRRLPMMHRLGWSGPKNSSQIYYAWFVWNRDHSGKAILDRIDFDDGAKVKRRAPFGARRPESETR